MYTYMYIYELIVVAHQHNAPTALLALLVAGAVKLVKQQTTSVLLLEQHWDEGLYLENLRMGTHT